MSTLKPWSKVGDVKKSKAGKFYIELGDDLKKLLGVETLILRTPADDLEGLVERDVITRAQADEKLAKIPEYVKFRVIVPPASK